MRVHCPFKGFMACASCTDFCQQEAPLVESPSLPISAQTHSVTESDLIRARLREAREFLGLSQDQVATKIGITRTALSALEGGSRHLKAGELIALGKLYRRPLAYFTGELETPLSPELSQMIDTLSNEDRATVLRFAEFLAHSGPPPTRGRIQ